MSYQQHTWVSGEIIKASQLNHIEEGIANEYTRATQSESDIYQAIDDETSRATQAEEGLSGLITQNTTAITTLNGNSSTVGSVDYKIAQATTGGVTGVKGSAESNYRTGNVSISKSNIGLGNVENFLAVSTNANQGLSDTQKANARDNIGVSNFSGDYNDLTNKPTIPSATSQLTNDSGFITYKAVSTVANQGLTETEKANARSNIGAGSSGFSGSYNDLTDKPFIPSKTSDLTNDSGFIAYKSVSVAANQGLTDTEKTNARANIGAGTSNFSGSYNDLSSKPTIPSKTSQLTNDSGFTTNTGTVTSVSAGVGLTGGPVSSSGTIKAKLKSETQSSLTAASRGTTSGREYPVGVDSNGDLSVNVPWSENFKKGTTAGGATADTLIFVYSGD